MIPLEVFKVSWLYQEGFEEGLAKAKAEGYAKLGALEAKTPDQARAAILAVVRPE